MFVNAHARSRLERRLGAVRADRVADALEVMPGEAGSVAIEVARFTGTVTDDMGSNGDRLVVIARGGEVCTVMLRRSWNQPFTAASLGVAKVQRLHRSVSVV